MINRVLIVGLGSIGQRHLRLARVLLPDADIRVLRRQITNEFTEYSDGCFTNINQAIVFGPQIAIIASPAPFHIEIAQVLADSGVHLLIEKPLSVSTKGVEKLIETCNKQNSVLLIGYNLRYLPSLNHFRDLLEKRFIGKVLSVRCETGQYLPSWRPNSDYRNGVSARHELGGGALLELSHELDYLNWIFGEIDWVKATLSRQSSLEIDVEDTVHLTIGFIPESHGHQLIGSINLDFIRHDTTRICTAIGESGSLRWNGLTCEVDYFPVGSTEWHQEYKKTYQSYDSYTAEWKHFINCVDGNCSPLVMGEDGLKVLKIIEAARNSAMFNTKVQVVRSGHSYKFNK